jgi:Flp pilus assembly pilin Flp
MPPRRRRPLRAFAEDSRASSAVETALILSLTAVMVYSVKAAGGIGTLARPAQQAFATLIRALS